MPAIVSRMRRRHLCVVLAFCILIAPQFHTRAMTDDDVLFNNAAAPSQQLEDHNTHSFELRTRLSSVEKTGRRREEEDYRMVSLARLDRDLARVRFLQTRAAATAVYGRKEEEEEENRGVPVTPGLTYGHGMYFAKIGLGTPVQEFDLVVDLESELTWVQCLPCTNCDSINLNHTASIFNHSQSSTYSPLNFTDERCPSKDNAASNPCPYSYLPGQHGDSFTVGEMATESITLGGKSASPEPGVVIGCAHVNNGERTLGAAGALGLGLGPLSIPSQLNLSSFSYCLIDAGDSSSSTSITLDVTQARPSGVGVAASLINGAYSHYYVDLIGISVGGRKMIPISSDPTGGKGGVIMDTVTTITRLQPDIYNSLRDDFLNASAVQRAPNFSIFDACFHLSSDKRSMDALPTVSFHFAGSEKELELPAKNSLFQVDGSGTYYCLAFAPDSPMSVIGNHQQQGMQVTYDLPNSRVVFLPGQC